MKLRNKIINEIAENNFSHITTNIAAGFDACVAQYLPIIEKLEDALKTNIAYIDSIWNLTKQVEIENICRQQKHFSQQALAELEQFKIKMNGGK